MTAPTPTAAPADPQPVAWMWQYIVRDPMADQIKPCARALHEMDPHNPPYPKTWKPMHPLYSADVLAALRAERDALRAALDDVMREARHQLSMREDYQDSSELERLYDAARATLEEK